MKRVMVLCCLLACVCFAFAGQSGEKANSASDMPLGMQMSDELATVTENAPSAEQMNEDLMNEMITLEGQLTPIKEEISALREQGIEGSPELWARYHQLMSRYEELEGRDREIDEPASLDQGGLTIATAVPIVLAGGLACLTGVTDESTTDECPTLQPHGEVWYSFAAPAAGIYHFTGCGTLGDLDLRIWTGATCAGASTYNDLTCGSYDPLIELTLTAGQVVLIEVGWYATGTPVGAYRFNLHGPLPAAGGPAPANDLCAGAIPLTIGTAVVGSTRFSTTEVFAPTTCGTSTSNGGSVWYSVAGNDNLLTASTNFLCTAINTQIKILTGPCGGPYTCVAGNLDSTAAPGNSLSIVQWCAAAGVNYWVVVMSGTTTLSSNGPFTLLVSDGPVCIYDCSTILPCGTSDELEPNDACADLANVVTLNCNGTFDATICQLTDVDYWYLPPTTPPQIITVTITDGANCATYPPTSFGLRVASTGNPPVCALPIGTTYFGGLFAGGCQPFGGAYLAVSRFGGALVGAYQLHVTCADYVCPCDVGLAGQECFSCVGPITDVATVIYDLPVATEYLITDLNLCFDATHTFRADVDMFLITPWSDTLEITTDNGGGGNNFVAMVFDDEAGASITTSPTTDNLGGSWIPEELLAAVDGYNAQGTWKLLITDDLGGDFGFVNCICLNFSYDEILAVELSDFDAIASDGEITLNWATASESNNDHFEVMRDGAMVTEVAATNSATGSIYSWTDSDVSNGTTYSYNLVSIDVMGGRTELGTVSATPNFGSATVNAYALHQNYPNPFNPTTNITFDVLEAGFVKLSVYNLLGQEVSKVVDSEVSAGRHTVTFDATGLSSGLYLYKMEVNGYSAQKKLLLMK